MGLGRKCVGSRIKVKVIGREVEKELGRWHWMGCPHGTEITKMGACVGVKQNQEGGLLGPCSGIEGSGFSRLVVHK